MRTDSLNNESCTLSGLENYSLGCTCESNKTIFRVLAPKAGLVTLVIYNDFDEEKGQEFPLEMNDKGIWETVIHQNLDGKWYAYKLSKPDGFQPFFATTPHPVADPWSKHVTSRNNHLQFHKTKITELPYFDWEDDNFVAPTDARDLVIYETHIKDMVAHPSSKTFAQGIYNDFRQAKRGGISHLKEMGVNAVEFLPLQKFAYFEPPFNQETPEGVKNTWNPYSRNYWGYMTSFYFVPETIYASDGTLEPERVIGRTMTAVNELKELIKALHKEGIAVILDVVYNHASHYDINPLKYTAKDQYFRLDEKGNYLNDSWTGNDINTSSVWSRKLIVESIKYWMKEFHIDGFRFDLAGLIDWDTADQIRDEARKINPNVILIAEPWGGDYKPDGYSNHDWAAWNDRFRNAFKGHNPREHKGLIFGEIDPYLSRYAIENLIRGTLQSGEHGLFKHSRHAVNYLESHDGNTLGDYIRIVLHPKKAEQRFEDKLKATHLTPAEMKTAKLAAAILFVSQGIAMMHAGQEWARTKIIQDPNEVDPKKGRIDHDSYNKDDETNWLNFDEVRCNPSLYKYYKGLINLRLNSPALRKANPNEISFKVYDDPLHITFSVDGKSSGDKYDYFVSLNANHTQSHEIVLPEGYWEMIVNEKKAGLNTFKSLKNTYDVPACSAVILRKLRVNDA